MYCDFNAVSVTFQRSDDRRGEGSRQGRPDPIAPARGAERGHVCDELYVDFNFVAHYCTHPDWREEPHADENEPMVEMEAYLARLVEAVGDGVAGRLVHRVRPKGATLLA